LAWAACGNPQQQPEVLGPSASYEPSGTLLTAASLSTLSVSPDKATVPIGGSLQLSVQGLWSDGSTSVPVVVWSTNGGAMTVSGVYLAPSVAGTYRIIATHLGGTLRDTATVTVGSVTTLVSLQVTPDPTTVAPGKTVQFKALATYSNGATGTPAVTWTATGGTISSSGLYTAGGSTGQFTVTALVSGTTIKDTAKLTIATATVTKLVLNPASASIFTGGTQQFSATATWSDGVSRAVSLSYAATGGTVSSSGLYQAGTSTGTYRVIVSCAASACSLTDTSAVTIQPTVSGETGGSLSISPKTITLDVGEVYQFTASALLSTGTTTSNPAVTWSATGGSATVGGWYRAPRTAGTYTVTITNSAGSTASAIVTVKVPTGPYFTDSFDSCALNKLPNALGFAWTHTGGGTTSERPVASSAISRSGSCSLKFTFLGGLPLDDSWSEQRFQLGKRLSEVYLQWYQYFPSGTESPSLGAKFVVRNDIGPDNDKFLRLWDDDYQNYNVKAGFSTLPSSISDGQLNTEYLWRSASGAGNSVANVGPWTTIVNSATRGRWVKFRVRMKLASSATAKDGALQLWLNDALTANFTALPLYSAQTGAKNYIRNGYLMGWANSGFTYTTHTFIDDVIISGVPIL